MKIAETKARLIKIVKEMISKDQMEGLILDGTKLSLILGQEDFQEIMIFNTTMIHVVAILSRMEA